MGCYALIDNSLVVDAADREYVLKIRDMPDLEKPREKLTTLGPKNLTVAELLAVVLGVGTKREDVLLMAGRVIKEYGEGVAINATDPVKLSAMLNIPEIKACQIIACFELGRRFFEKKEGRAVYLRTAKQAYQYVKDMGALKKEHLRGLYLNSRYQVVHDEVISVGSATTNIIHPREVFGPAIEHSSVAVILAHNHPSGDPTPTGSDIEANERLIEAGKVLGIDLLDHIVVAKSKFLSIMEVDSHEDKCVSD